MSWKEIKKRGPHYYKTDGVEPIDLYKSVGVIEIFALCNLIKYAFRILTRFYRDQIPINQGDLNKMRHYLDMVETSNGEEKEETAK